jgi:sugar lactone lactonase YvrE
MRASLWALLLAILSASAARAQNITAGGIISTAAGNGVNASAGAGGLATTTPIGGPLSVALDRTGNIYLIDRFHNQVDVVNEQAAAITIAGVTIQPANTAVIVGATGSCGSVGAIGDGGPAIDALLCGPSSLAIDAKGNIYIADVQDSVIRVVNTEAAAITIAGVTIQPSDIQTIVGTGVSSTTGNGGPASSATLTTPTGIALDAAGNIYIVDDGSYVVRVVNTQAAAITIAGVTIPPNDIQTIAGTVNSGGYGGDGGPATSSTFNLPFAVALDAAGNIYIVDGGNAVIRVINPQATAAVTVAGISIPAGDIKTIAGNGTPGYLGNGGAATSAELNNPIGVFVEANGNILIADANNEAVRLVNTVGTISTFAGNNTSGYTGDAGFATSAELASPHAAVSDAAGDVYIADFLNARIREVVAGTTKFGSVAVGQTVTLPIGLTFNAGLTLATLSGKGDNAVSSVGTCTLGVAYVSGNSCILSVTFTPSAPGPRWFPVTATDSLGNVYSFALQGTAIASATAFTPGIITTIVGTGTAGYAGDGGPAISAEIGKLWESTVDSAGNLYLVDHDNQRIRVVNRQSSAITVFGVTIPAGDIQTVAGDGTAGALGNGALATSAELNAPEGVVLDSAGNLYIADSANNEVRKVTPAGIISIVAGGSANCAAATDVLGDGCPATTATLDAPNGVAFDASGNLYVVDTFDNAIRKVSPAGIITTVAGTSGAVCGAATDAVGDGCPAITAALTHPGGVAFDAVGNLYIADFGANRVRKVNTNGVITTVAGTGTAGFTGDGGVATSAELDGPFRVSIDAAGDLYIDDATNERIRVLATNGDISTVAGDGIAGALGNLGSATAAELSNPDGAAVDAAGNLYIADGANHVVREVSVTTAPTETFGTLDVGQTTAPMGVGLSNVGNAALNLSALTWPTGFHMATVGGDCAVGTPVALGATCDVGTVFAPSTAGPFSASLTVADNAFDAPFSIPLTGSSNLAATALPATLTFANQPVGVLSATQAVTLTNPNGAAVTGITITFTGTNGTEFTQTNNCTATLAADSTCTINVGFTPTAVGSGTHTGQLNIADSDPSSPQTVALMGTVVKGTPVITWATPAPIAYGTALSATQLDATASVAGTFVYTPAAGTTPVAGSDTLSVTFTPTDTTDYTTATSSVTLTVNQLIPTITWATPAPITYGTTLSATQFDATANTPGTFVYSPAVGYLPTAGQQVLDVTFSPTDTVDYTSASVGIYLTVNKATPIITWATPAPIAYLTPLSATQLDATASVAGSFVYAPASGTVLTAGAQTLHTTFTPTDGVDYTTATGTASLTVNQLTPVITWTTPAAITYPTALSATQLDATASVPGTFVYAPLAGTVPTAGNDFLTVTFTPTDAVDYATATANVTLVVHQAIPVITWAAPAAITYGTALSATQLDATASVPGTFAYTPAAGTIPTAGSQTLSVTFTPTDTVDYTSPTATVALTVNKATPVITWPVPAAITYGTALSVAQLDATANTPGTFVYTPAAGVVLTAGTQVLDVTFSPTDAVDYTSASAGVSLTVNKATPIITWATPAAITYGTDLSATQLDATASTAGTFVYTPATGAALTAGSQTLNVTFTPTDAADFTTATGSVTLIVNQAVPVITWATPAAITYPTPLSAAQLNATASVPGTFVYSPLAASVPTAGNDILTVTFTPTNAVDYATATASVTLVVHQAVPVVTWAAPASIIYGTALSATQLDATASVPGTFAYTPLAGAILTAGSQTLDGCGRLHHSHRHDNSHGHQSHARGHLGRACGNHLRHSPERHAT